MSLLQVTLGAGATGAVIILAGKADRTSPTRLAEVLDAQLSGRGGNLTLVHPQQPVLRLLTTMGADQMLTIVEQTAATAGHLSTTAGSPAPGSPPPGPCDRGLP